MSDIIGEYVCTNCIRWMDRDPILKLLHNSNHIITCDVCKKDNRCCFYLEKQFASHNKDNYITRLTPEEEEPLESRYLDSYNNYISSLPSESLFDLLCYKYRYDNYLASIIPEIVYTRAIGYCKRTRPRYSDYHMWKDGVEYDMGILLCLIRIGMNNEGLYIPIEIIKLIYGIAKRVSNKNSYIWQKKTQKLVKTSLG